MSNCFRSEKLLSSGASPGSSLRYSRYPSNVLPPGTLPRESQSCPPEQPTDPPAASHGGSVRRQWSGGKDPASLLESSQVSSGSIGPALLPHSSVTLWFPSVYLSDGDGGITGWTNPRLNSFTAVSALPTRLFGPSSTPSPPTRAIDIFSVSPGGNSSNGPKERKNQVSEGLFGESHVAMRLFP